MNGSTAAPPMYDRLDLHAAMDRLWREIAHELHSHGMGAPVQLARELPYDARWT